MIDLNQIRTNAAAQDEKQKAQHLQDMNIITELIDQYYDDGANDWERRFLKGNLAYLEALNTNVLSAKVRGIALAMDETIQKRNSKPY